MPETGPGMAGSRSKVVLAGGDGVTNNRVLAAEFNQGGVFHGLHSGWVCERAPP